MIYETKKMWCASQLFAFTFTVKVLSLTYCIENRLHTHTYFSISILIPKVFVNDLQNTNSHHPEGWVSPVSFLCA